MPTPAYRGRDRQGRHVYRLRPWDGTRQVSQTFKIGGGKRAADIAADEEMARVTRRIRQNSGVDHDRTLGGLWDAYLDHVVATNRYSPTTLRDHKATMKATIVPELGKIKLRDLTSYRLDQFYAKEQERGLSARTVLKYHRLLSTVFRQAERWGWIEVSPTHNATPPQVPHRDVTAPGADVILALLGACKDELTGLLVLLAASLGARRGELMGLRWDDIDYKLGTIAIRRSIYEPPGGGVAVKPTKTDRPRTITLTDKSTDVLHRLSAGRSGYVFSADGEHPWRPTRATRTYENLRKKVPLAAGVRLHDLRHFHATALIALGFDPATVAKRLGHANISTTLDSYTAALSERDRAASTAIGELLSGDEIDSGVH